MAAIENLNLKPIFKLLEKIFRYLLEMGGFPEDLFYDYVREIRNYMLGKNSGGGGVLLYCNGKSLWFRVKIYSSSFILINRFDLMNIFHLILS